jgi:hypothetical protein
MGTLAALLPGRIVTRVAREVKMWRWRRERSRNGAPVTLSRRRAGRAFMFESRRPEI